MLSVLRSSRSETVSDSLCEHSDLQNVSPKHTSHPFTTICCPDAFFLSILIKTLKREIEQAFEKNENEIEIGAQ